MMSMIRNRFILGGLGTALVVSMAALAVLIGGYAGTSAQVGTKAAVNQYASKYLCGAISSPASASQVLAPGVYNTAINIHNPNNFNVTLQKKAVVSAQEPAQGMPGGRVTEVLQPDASMEVDCSQIDNLLAGPPPANPACSSIGGAGLPPSFCKGYMVTEAAQIINTPQGPQAIPAQIDVTDIITVKEEDGIWKDYTFKLHCVAPCGLPPIVDQSTNIPYRYDTAYNWPDRPATPLCYGVQTQLCDIYDIDQLVRQRLTASCACGTPSSPQLSVILVDDAFATDARSVALHYEFVQGKRVAYPKWPVQVNGCDLSIGKVGQPGVPTAGTITYTITVTCAGPVGGLGSVGNVHVHDLIPPISLFGAIVPSVGTCNAPPQESTSNLLTCDLGVMSAGSSATIVFKVDTGGNVTVQDTATVDPHNTIAEPNETNNTVTISNFVP